MTKYFDFFENHFVRSNENTKKIFIFTVILVSESYLAIRLFFWDIYRDKRNLFKILDDVP